MHPFQYSFVHHLDLDSLMTSVKQGCDICRSVHEKFYNKSPLGQPVPGHLTHFCISSFISLTGGLAYHAEFFINATFEAENLRYGPPSYICTLIALEGERLL